MSKNAAIEIVLRVRPHKNVYPGFSTQSITQVWIKRNARPLSSSLRIKMRGTSIIRMKRECLSSTKCLIWTPNKRKFSIKLPRMSWIPLCKVLTAPYLPMVKLVVVKLSR